MSNVTSSSSSGSSSSSNVSGHSQTATRKLGFAFSIPTMRDGLLVYIIGKLTARVTAQKTARLFCHCELFFDDDRCFGITTAGVHFYRRTLALDEYRFYAIDVPEPKYLDLIRRCEECYADKKLTFSSSKGVFTHLFCTSWVAHRLYSKNYTYCSELVARLLRDSEVMPWLHVNGASPNDIADSVLSLLRDNQAYICLGPALVAHHNDEFV
jgi:hypothetical protein